ncbi:MAG: hypothetical protein KBT27_02160 [Prevotellaceae bacterium]|nr:hypothetical protein [Candidatus Faecinaster equi]
MIDFHSTLVSALNDILPTCHETVRHPGMATPCISYLETNNYDTQHRGDTIVYSNIVYQVKVWDKSIATIQSYVPQIDAAMRSLGFHRISSGELYDKETTMIQKLLTYEALASEIIGGNE